MDRLTRTARRRVATGLVAATLAIGGLGLAACSDDDDEAGAPSTTVTEPVDGPTTTTFPMSASTVPPETGDIEVPDFPGTFAIAIPSLGFGLALPEGWQATKLDAEAIEQLQGATLDQPAFLESAEALAETGALFYAVGIDDLGRVAEVKVSVDDDADTDPVAVRAEAERIIAAAGLTNTTVVEGDGRVRIDYRSDGTAADGTPVSALGSQLLVVDGDRLWSFIVTSEDQATQDAVLTIVDATITFDA